MKPFDQWVDEIRAQNNPAPPDDYTTNSEGMRCEECGGHGYVMKQNPAVLGDYIETDCEWCMEMGCSGGCGKTGKPNYGDLDNPAFYCGGSPLCCP